MEFLSYFKDFFVLIIIGICMCIGYIIKNLVPSDKVNKFIPLIVAVLGVLLNLWIAGGEFTPEILLGGLASGLASTGTYEAIKNIKNSKVNDSNVVETDIVPHDLE